MDNPLPQTQAARRARISYACEACRAAKVKCQPSSQHGICRRCSDSKRECIFKTGPRTRRPRTKRLSSTPSTARPTVPPPVGPSKTFTIDIPMQAESADLAGSLETLRLSHEMYVDDLLSPAPDEYVSYSEYTDEEEEDTASPRHRPGSVAGTSSASHASSLPLGASALSTPPSSVSLAAGAGKGKKKSVLASLGVRPQFNLDSAEKLLAEFESRMLLHFPAVAPPPVQCDGEEPRFSVPELAQTKPFVLLAILAAASGSRTLQGHSLYDDEFRKILGLKFVAGGERSLELLQGLVVYTAWYPFHLRPKNKQALQYIRMVVDMVTDLELDQDLEGDEQPPHKASGERLEQVRAYLSAFYLVSTYAEAWNKTPALCYNNHTAKCCSLLERDSTMKGDHVLAWLVRIQHILEEVSKLRKVNKTGGQNEYQISLMLKGMESQLAEWACKMSPEISSTPSIRLALLFAKTFIPAAPLLKLPMPKPKRRAPSSSSGQGPGHDHNPQPFVPDAARLTAAVPDIRAFFDWVLTLPAAELNSFSGTEWGRFILVVILAFRLSFPVPDCPAWDDGWAREEIGFGGYLERLEGMGSSDGRGEGSGGGGGAGGTAAATTDVLGAGKVVLAVVRKKWEKRAAGMRASRQGGKGVALGTTGQECPQGIEAGVPLEMELDVGLDPTLLDRSMRGCPMIDGSLEAYYPLWDETFSAPAMSGMAVDLPGVDVGGAPAEPAGEYVDVWGNIMAGWAQWPQPDGGFEGGDLP